MAPPFPRPGYVPEPAWSCYLELLEPGPTGRPSPLTLPIHRERFRRLFGLHRDPDATRDGTPKIAKTWRHLAAEIEPPTRPHPWSAQDWRLLLDLFWTLPAGFDAPAYRAVRRARELSRAITEHAGALAAALSEYETLANRHGLDRPDAAAGAFEWLTDAAAGMDPDARARFDEVCAPWFGVSVRRRVEIDALPYPAEMVETLARAFDGFEPTAPECNDEANGPQEPGITGIVRHFERRWSQYQGTDRPDMRPPFVMAARFQIGNTDTARILSALFDLTVTPDHVRDVRKTRATDRASDRNTQNRET
jgi:hypothetical protein